MKNLKEVFEWAKSENRAALIGYMPAGFPSSELSARLIDAMVDGGVDIVEVGFPYSDPVMDGPVIQQAAEISLRNGTSANDVLAIVSQIKVPALVMSYWNPIEKFGVEKFATELSKSGGVGVITPDLTIEESALWITATDTHHINRVYVVAPSTSDARLAEVTKACSGFIYAASLMGVTGVRSTMSTSAADLVTRIRKISKTPVCVGLGVSTGAPAKEIAKYADGVIVGSAFLKLLLEGRGPDAVGELAKDLSRGVRKLSN